MIKTVFIFLFFLFGSALNAQQQVNPNLFGFATSNTFIYFNVHDSSFIKNVDQISPNVLRFPGGSLLGNFYHLDGSAYGFDINEIDNWDIEKFSKRARGLIIASEKRNHQHNYIEDFILLSKKTNSKAVLVANIMDDNFDILGMIQRLKENNITILGVELGCELANKTFYHNMDIDRYISFSKRTSDKIKEHFPNMKVGVVAAPYTNKKNHRHVIWNKKLAKLDFYDAIIVHSYAKVMKGKNKDGQMISEQKEGGPKHAFGLYKKRLLLFFDDLYPNQINQYNSVFNNKPIWITEWNLQISKTTGNTLFQSLFTANYLLEISSNPNFSNIDIATFHNLAGRDFAGSIFQRRKKDTDIHSTFPSMKIIKNVLQDSNFMVKKHIISPEFFSYQFLNKQGILSKELLINWSSEDQPFDIKKHFLTRDGENIFYRDISYRSYPEADYLDKNYEYKLEELYASPKFDTHSEKKVFNNLSEKIMIVPYSMMLLEYSL